MQIGLSGVKSQPMKFMRLAFALGLAACGYATDSHASSSDWVMMQGGRVRLVTAGEPDGSGTLRGVLHIELAPGWKTYWRDPGDAGVPPSVDLSASRNISLAGLDFPPPERHRDGEFAWAGYDRPVALPITFHVKDPGRPVTISAAIFLGICESICVPVHAELKVDPASDPHNPDDTSLVNAALSALPEPATDEFGLKTVEASEDHLLVEAVLPQGATDADVFIASDDGYAFREPKKVNREGDLLFRIPVIKPAQRPSGAGLHYTLVTDAGAVSGTIPYF
ncbi:protein-disulfide reductase DsbD domain-containing protein [Pseudaminobacter soli (ex Zhang et al. 2022)]|nr:protein-disulfide reductase DsbD domain-containing protein [Pseudaminobacter soli]